MGENIDVVNSSALFVLPAAGPPEAAKAKFPVPQPSVLPPAFAKVAAAAQDVPL